MGVPALVLLYWIFQPWFLPLASEVNVTPTWKLPVSMRAGATDPQKGPYSRPGAET